MDFDRTPVRRCRLTHLMLPSWCFRKVAGEKGMSVLGSLFISVSTRAVNGRYRESRTARGKDLTYVHKGIRMAYRWVDDPTLFALEVVSDIGFPPSARHSLDRIDNDGHYEVGNIRWVLPHAQAANKGGHFPAGSY